MLTLLWFVLVIIGFVALAYVSASRIAWTSAAAVALALGGATRALPPLPQDPPTDSGGTDG